MFTNENIKADYVENAELKSYLEQKLKTELGDDYTVKITTKPGDRHIDVTIDETGMSDDAFDKLEAFKNTHQILNDIGVLSKFLNMEQGGNHFYDYLSPDLDGVYVIRHSMELNG